MKSSRLLATALLAASYFQAPAHAEPVTAAALTSITRTPPEQDPAHMVTQPLYPPGSVERREEGSIILKFVVSANGSVKPGTIQVEESTGFPELDASAVQEARSWRFLPGMENGYPVESEHQFRVVFELSKRFGVQFGLHGEGHPPWSPDDQQPLSPLSDFEPLN